MTSTPSPVDLLVGQARTNKIMERIAPVIDAQEIERGMDPPQLLVDFSVRHNAEIDAGRGRGCLHLPDGPEVVAIPRAVAVWLPGTTVCVNCIGLLKDALDETTTWVCDHCGLYLPEQIALSVIQDRALLVVMGLCREGRQLLAERRL